MDIDSIGMMKILLSFGDLSFKVLVEINRSIECMWWGRRDICFL